MGKPRKQPSPRAPAGELARLRARLAECETRCQEAEDTLRAIRSGEVDALLVNTPTGDQVFTLQGAESTYRFLVEEMNEAALLLGPYGTILYANARFASLAGAPLEQVIGVNWERFFVPEELHRLRELLQAAQCGSAKREFQLQGAGAARCPVAVSLSSMRRTDVQGFSVVITDLTERKAAEADLAERTAQLQELVGELEHFSYTITHDMRAPLRAMRGFGELVLETYAANPEPQSRALLQRIIDSAQRMDLLITDALSYSKAVRQHLPLGPVDVGSLLHSMLDSYPELQSAREHITLQGPFPLVLGNQAGLTQCFSNLLGNALKFVKPGQKPQIRIWAEEFANPAGQPAPTDGPPAPGKVRIWVEDQGIGIPPAMLPRIFDMFARGSKTYEGTGIGLALVRKVVHRMGGWVGVESEPGQGTRFWLELLAGDPRSRSGVA